MKKIFILFPLFFFQCKTNHKLKEIPQGSDQGSDLLVSEDITPDEAAKELQSIAGEFGEHCKPNMKARICVLVDSITEDGAEEPLREVLADVIEDPNSTILEDAEDLTLLEADSTNVSEDRKSNAGAIALITIGSLGVVVGGRVAIASILAEKKVEKLRDLAKDKQTAIDYAELDKARYLTVAVSQNFQEYKNVMHGLVEVDELGKPLLLEDQIIAPSRRAEMFLEFMDKHGAGHPKNSPDYYLAIRKAIESLKIKGVRQQYTAFLETHMFSTTKNKDLFDEWPMVFEGKEKTLKTPLRTGSAMSDYAYSMHTGGYSKMDLSREKLLREREFYNTKIKPAEVQLENRLKKLNPNWNLDTIYNAPKYSKIAGAVVGVISAGLLAGGLGTYGYRLESSTTELEVQRLIQRLRQLYQRIKNSRPSK